GRPGAGPPGGRPGRRRGRGTPPCRRRAPGRAVPGARRPTRRRRGGRARWPASLHARSPAGRGRREAGPCGSIGARRRRDRDPGGSAGPSPQGCVPPHRSAEIDEGGRLPPPARAGRAAGERRGARRGRTGGGPAGCPTASQSAPSRPAASKTPPRAGPGEHSSNPAGPGGGDGGRMSASSFSGSDASGSDASRRPNGAGPRPASGRPGAGRPGLRRWLLAAAVLATAGPLPANAVAVSRARARAAGGPVLHLAGGGVQVHQDGPRGAPALVLAHWLAGSARWWDPLVPALAESHRVVRVDLLGHGRSAKPAGGGYAIPEQGRLVGEVLDRLGVRRAVLVGHSTGGSVATALAEQRPGLVTGLALIGSGPRLGAFVSDGFVGRLLSTPVVGQLLWRVRTDGVVRRGLETAFS